MIRQTSSDSWSLGEETAGDEMVRTVVFVRCSAAGSVHCVIALSRVERRHGISVSARCHAQMAQVEKLRVALGEQRERCRKLEEKLHAGGRAKGSDRMSSVCVVS